MSSSIRYLYRYYHNLEHILDVLERRRLYNCRPSEFNDPFDCRPLISIKQSRADESTWYKFLYYLARQQFPEASDVEHKKHAHAAIAKSLHHSKPWLSAEDESLRNIPIKIRVCCFAKSARNMMMWAHYANNHQGLVFQFRASHLKDVSSGEFRGMDVFYAPRPLGVKDYLYAVEQAEKNDSLPLARMAYSTKTIHWEHEEEVRFFADLDHPYTLFEESALPAIIFGDRCRDEFIRQVMYATAKWQRKPRFFKAAIEKTSFRLWIRSY